MVLPVINFVAVVVAAFVSMVLGFLWFGLSLMAFILVFM